MRVGMLPGENPEIHTLEWALEWVECSAGREMWLGHPQVHTSQAPSRAWQLGMGQEHPVLPHPHGWERPPSSHTPEPTGTRAPPFWHFHPLFPIVIFL